VIEAIVIVLETPILRWLLRIDWRRAFLASLAANAVSALLGLPLAFIGGSLFGNRVLTGTLLGDAVIVLVPVLISFVVSSAVEWPVVKLVTRSSWSRSALAVLAANAASHALLLVLWYTILSR
jgi:preprotein translocase subunit SecD